MSKKPKAPVFCETQCSDDDSDEDYIDQLIKKKGDQALNALLRENDNQEQEIEQEEIIELRDSLVPQPLSKPTQSKPVQQDLQVESTNTTEGSRTPKSMIGYHKKKGSIERSSQQQMDFGGQLAKERIDSSQNNLKSALLSLNEDSPGLEHQDTIVRKPASELSDPSNIPFSAVLDSAIDYFSQQPLPQLRLQNPDSSLKATALIQNQLLLENENLKLQINKMHQKQYQLRGKNKELQRQVQLHSNRTQETSSSSSKEVNNLQQQLAEMQMHLVQLNDLYEKEKLDKEHTTIAYKRILQKMESEKYQQQQHFQQSFISQSSHSGLDTRKSPSPLRSSIQTDLSITHKQMIHQLQEELAKKDNQISFYKGRQQQTSHLHSEENILDDLEEDDQQQQYLGQGQLQGRQLMYSQNTSQTELTPYKVGAHLQNGMPPNQVYHGGNTPQQFYSYENTSPMQFSSQNSHLPTNSTTFSTHFFRDRAHSPSPLQGGYAKHHTQQQLTSSSCSSSSHISQQQLAYNKQIPDKSFIQAHHARLRNQSPQATAQMQYKVKQPHTVAQSIAFQVNTSQGVFSKKRMQTETAVSSNQGGLPQRKKNGAKQRPQYLLTNSSGSSCLGAINGHPMLSAPIMSSSGCGSDEDDL